MFRSPRALGGCSGKPLIVVLHQYFVSATQWCSNNSDGRTTSNPTKQTSGPKGKSTLGLKQQGLSTGTILSLADVAFCEKGKGKVEQIDFQVL